MTFFHCVERAINDDEIKASKERGERAKKMWQDLSDEYERQGYTRHNAEALAGEDVKKAFRKEAGDQRHVFLAQVQTMRKLQRNVRSSTSLTSTQTRSVEQMDYEARGLVRYFNGRLGAFLREHHRNLLGNVTKPAQMKNIVRELHGESTGDEVARALAEGVREAMGDLRIMANEAGALIGHLENYGLPHSHSRRMIARAGFDQWFGDIQKSIDWKRIENFATKRPFQTENGPPPSMAIQRRFLQDIYDNLAYGKGSREAVYGRPQGQALYKQMSESRTLHFKSADDWISYNKKYGTGDPYRSLMSHVHKMARDIVAMRNFGPNPGMGIRYQNELAMQRARKDGLSATETFKIQANGSHAERMMQVERGGTQPESLQQEKWATFFSSARHVMTAAFLDRAIIASISDLNSMRLAAKAVGFSPRNVLSRHVGLIARGLKRDDALRAGWVADTLADPGAALARFQSEVPPAEVAERLSSASMRIQGLSGWTDQARIAFQMEMAGHIASFAERKLAEVDGPLRKHLDDAGITSDEWDHFRGVDVLFKASNGATFASPHYFRANTSLPRDRADDIFLKFQAMIEEQTEYAVPTQSLWARGAVDPAAYGITPGTIPFEIMKSGLMFKSFTMTFTVNQIRRIVAQSSHANRVLYGLELAAGATLLGAVALQLGELVKGNDPSDMTNPGFWGKATLKGGGFGILGDIVATGETSWGGGFGSYVSGPMPQAANDIWGLTVSNALEFASGEDTEFAKEFSRFGKRYTPMGQTPVIGPAMDRLFWDQLQMFLDPTSRDALVKSATRRNNLNGTSGWWETGDVLPNRAPDLANAIGG